MTRSFANIFFALIADTIDIGGTRISCKAKTRAALTTVAAALGVAQACVSPFAQA
jgi:hypothetical protein